jgi:hypothetical protein
MTDGRFIYFICDPEAGFVRYVGASVNPKRRFGVHRTCSHVAELKSWSKGLAERGLKPVLEEYGFFEDWENEERFMISYLRFLGQPLLNVAKGGMRGSTVADETKRRLREFNEGKKLTLDHIEKIRASNIGRVVSPESIARNVASHRRKKAERLQKGIVCRHSPETVARRRASLIATQKAKQEALTPEDIAARDMRRKHATKNYRQNSAARRDADPARREEHLAKKRKYAADMRAKSKQP